MELILSILFFGLIVSAIATYMFQRNQQKKAKKTQYGKWVGAGLGFVLGAGPIGGILGFIFGSMYDSMQSGSYAYQGTNTGAGYDPSQGTTRPGDFGVSLVILAASVMKADGTVMKSELEYVKAFFIRQFGIEGSERYILLLRDVLKQDVRTDEVAAQIRSFMEYSSRLQLVHFLFGIAGADGQFSETEVNLIQQISRQLGLSLGDYTSIKAMFVKDSTSAYQILGLTSAATDDEVKKAYRQMAVLHHPDKVGHLGEEVQHAAKEKFQQINAAYDQIKKERGIK
ncbi:MAG: TerB family tellurite resistance protein [Sphingobacteriia bacterium]|nr:TerB family tellurite resistance protein [Sphingobacteriia bacterium]